MLKGCRLLKVSYNTRYLISGSKASGKSSIYIKKILMHRLLVILVSVPFKKFIKLCSIKKKIHCRTNK